MENLHLKNLKNLNNLPTGYIIIKKLQNEIQKNYYIESHELRDEIATYIKSLKFKNKEIKEYINNFLILLKEDPNTIKIVNRLEEIIRIITLLYKYNLNKLDINDKLNFTNINNDIIKLNNLHSIKLINFNNTIYQNSILFSYHTISYPYSKYSTYKSEIIYITGLNNTITDIRNDKM